jgi:hypothetical protein
VILRQVLTDIRTGLFVRWLGTLREDRKCSAATVPVDRFASHTRKPVMHGPENLRTADEPAGESSAWDVRGTRVTFVRGCWGGRLRKKTNFFDIAGFHNIIWTHLYFVLAFTITCHEWMGHALSQDSR